MMQSCCLQSSSSSVVLLLSVVWSVCIILSPAVTVDASPMATVMDASGRMFPIAASSAAASAGVVTVVTSPGVPSILVPNEGSSDGTDGAILSVESDWGILICRGCTLASSIDVSESEQQHQYNGLAASSAVSDAMVVEGITMGDIEGGGLRTTRHARTLTALFQSRANMATIDRKQVLILAVSGAPSDIDDSGVVQDVRALFQSATVGVGATAMGFDDLYDLRVMPASATVLSSASDAARSVAEGSTETAQPLSAQLKAALEQVKDSTSVLVEAPHITEATVAVGIAFTKHSATARTKVAAWKSRIARGLLVDGFGKDATTLRQRLLSTYDAETLVGAGLPSVAAYRMELRLQLQQLIDTAIQQAFAGQVTNLERLTLKRFQAELLKTVNSKDSVETITTSNAATLRKDALLFETAMDDLEVPTLGLSKDKASRDLSSKLNDALDAYPDSPAAKLKRLLAVNKVVNKEKAPGERSVSFGLDLVAMLRPDGFGSLQGYAGYQLPGGNSITFGVHNDADDPQVISQFGGVRPPLLRVQPKLRVDVEM